MATIDTIQLAGGGVVKLGVWPRDHCDPHATCWGRAVPWTVRICFSFIDNTVTLKDVIPAQNGPPAHVISHLEQTVAGNLLAFRQKWWQYQCNNPASQASGACCLNNKTVGMQKVVSAKFDAVNGKTAVALADGTFYYWPP
jgi:hypothetical protein